VRVCVEVASNELQLKAGMIAQALNGCVEQPAPVEWQFLQCFGERTPGEEVQEGGCLVWEIAGEALDS
jgi:hypothetical protein